MSPVGRQYFLHQALPTRLLPALASQIKNKQTQATAIPRGKPCHSARKHGKALLRNLDKHSMLDWKSLCV